MRPFKRARQIFPSIRLVQPELAIRHNEGRADEPHPRSLFFDKNLPSSEFLANRNLAIRADDLHAGFSAEIFHICTLSLLGRGAALT